MSRQARIRIADGVYHVTTHGNGDMMIFEQPSEKWQLLDLLVDTAKEYDWAMYAWCVMGNHYHFLLKTPDNNLSEGMHHINMSYGEWYNKSRGRHGHVFQDRFFSIMITEDSHLLEASRYVVLNPLRASLVTAVHEWPWSSYGAGCALSRSATGSRVDGDVRSRRSRVPGTLSGICPSGHRAQETGLSPDRQGQAMGGIQRPCSSRARQRCCSAKTCSRPDPRHDRDLPCGQSPRAGNEPESNCRCTGHKPHDGAAVSVARRRKDATIALLVRSELSPTVTVLQKRNRPEKVTGARRRWPGPLFIAC